MKLNKKPFPIVWLVVMVIIFFMGVLSRVEAGEKFQECSAYSITDFQFLEDVNGEYPFDTIISPSLVNQFKPYPEKVISLGISKSVYWVRFRLPEDEHLRMDTGYVLQLNNPNIDKIDVFIPIDDPSSILGVCYLAKATGVSRSFANMDVKDNTWVFSIPSQIRQDQFIYLRLESTSALRLPVLLWKTQSFIAENLLKNLGFGLFFGILLAMFFYNFFIYIVLRDKVYLFYILYIAFMLLYQLQVHGFLKFWLDIPYPIYNSFFWLCLAAAFISSICFTCAFLQVHSGEAFWSGIMKILVMLALLQGILGFFNLNFWANQIAHGLGLIGPLSIIVLAGIRLRQGFKPAWYYLLAWGVLLAGIVVWVLSAYIPDTFSAVNYLLVSTASECILLSFALAYRFKTMRLRESVMKKHIRYYRDLSLIDELTGIYNKRHMRTKIREEVEIAHKTSKPLTLMVMDIDHFKNYNDSYGHWEGDQVLIRLGELLLNTLEDTQLAFRYGGEEFVVILPRVTGEDAANAAEKVRTNFEKEQFKPNDTLLSVTVSIGITALKEDDSIESLFQRADEAMYKAKKSGRNRVIFL